MSEYRLEPVRTLRDVGARASTGVLADAVADSRATAHVLARAREKVAAVRAQIAAARAVDHREARAIARAEQYLARLRRDLEAARVAELRALAAHDATIGAVDVARARVVAARADKEVVERHFAQWRVQQRKAAERKEE